MNKAKKALIGGVSLVMAMVAVAPGASLAMQPSEIGYQTGALAVSDLVQGRFDRAEHTLAAQSAEDAADPARLVNLGILYVRTGRLDEARSTFARVNRVPEAMLILSDGRELSSRVVASAYLARLPAP